MTNREFFKKIANGKSDFLQSFLNILKQKKVPFCVIGGLGVNAYAEPLVSLDLDIVIVADRLEVLVPLLQKKFRIEHFSNSVNVSHKGSDLRIQIQTDPRYQGFINRAKMKDVLGYKIPVALIEDLFQGKIWVAMDEKRRPSKRQKDLADILRLLEAQEELKKILPAELRKQLKLD